MPDAVGTALAGADTVVVGPGVADPEAASDLVGAGARRHSSDGTRLVVDALGSAFLTDRPDGLGPAAARTVVTVNPTELAHVLGVEAAEVEADLATATAEASRRTGGGGGRRRCGEARRRARRKGLAGGRGGGPGLGVSGSGDVQSGHRRRSARPWV